MSARAEILERFPSLSPQLQTAARFVVDHPQEVVIESMRSLAVRAGVLPVTLVRLAQQLGYDGWPALKRAFAQDLGLDSDRYGERALSLAARRERDLTGELFGAQRANLDATETQSAAAMRPAARLLQRAETIHVAGFRASQPIAYALFYGLRLLRDTVQLVDGNCGALEMQLRAVARRHAMVVASFAPYSREALLAAQAARAAGAKLVAFSDSSASPLALEADASLVFSARSPSFFPSITAGVALAEALLELLVAEGGRPVADRIARSEQQLIDSGAYVSLPRRGKRGDATP